ncbi:hypothetical protein NMY22_g3061 [Coprinellus aureogranulatus]|nr:hypothetical protein NMY22_g3061 [Coprinellus aureogranulatus]
MGGYAEMKSAVAEPSHSHRARRSIEPSLCSCDRLTGTYREALRSVHPPRTTVHLSESRLPQLFVSFENEFISELNRLWVYSISHIFQLLWALMLNRLGDRIAAGDFSSPKPLPPPPDIPEPKLPNSRGEEGPPTPLAHPSEGNATTPPHGSPIPTSWHLRSSSSETTIQAVESAPNSCPASPVTPTPVDLEQTPAPPPSSSDDHRNPAARPNVNARYYLTDFQIERTDSVKDKMSPLTLTELCITGIPGQEEEVLFALSEISSGLWVVTEVIALPAGVEGIHCVERSKDKDISFFYLDFKEIGGATQPDCDMRCIVSGGGTTTQFNIIDMAPESVLPEDARDSIYGSGSNTRPARFATTGSNTQPARFATTDSNTRPARFATTGSNNGTLFMDMTLLARVAEAWRLIRMRSPVADFGAVLDRAAGLMRLFERTGNFTLVEDADAILQAGKRAMLEGLPGANFLEKANALRKSEVELKDRFQATGDLELIAEAIAREKQLLRLVPEHLDMFPETLHNLSGSLATRYQHTGDLSDLAEAISTQRKAITLMADDEDHLPCMLNTLGIQLRMRFERTGNPSDFNEGLSAHQRAVQVGREDNPCLPIWLGGVGHAFRVRFDLTGDLLDLDEAISAQRRAVSLTAEGHQSLPLRLHALGSYLSKRFDTTSNPPDLDESISAYQRSIQLTPEGHPDLPTWLTNLGTSLAQRFRHSNDPSDVAQGVSALERAADLTPEGHVNFPEILSRLGDYLRIQHLMTGRWKPLSRSLSSYRLAATCTSGHPQRRLKAAEGWIKLLTVHSPQSTDILVAFGVALGLVSLIGGLEETVQGRHSQLQDISGITLEAASAAFMLGHPDKALEFLEQGRCLVWNQLNNLRTPLDTLRLQDQQLADRITKVSAKLENAGSSRQHAGCTTSFQEKSRLEDEALEHVNLAKQWDNLLREVRSKPGFETFLHPPTSATLLQHLPESGVVVVINVNEKRCDAIGLMAGLDEPLHIPLPNFSLEKAKKYRENLKHRLSANHLRVRDAGRPEHGVDCSEERAAGPFGSRRKANQEMAGVLRGLWVEVVKPILEALAFTKLEPSSDEPAPRIWWCPTGPLSFLPLHAAGIYSAGATESVLDYAVSSYTPTVTSLTERVKGDRPIDKDVSGLFLTCQPNATGCTPIPGTAREVDDISSTAKSNGIRVLKLAGAEVSGQDCVKLMEKFSSVHLACHASQYAAEPLKSRFSFHNDRLELSTILRSNLKNADLAFLSACQTSTGEEKLSDEAVHLAAGMLAAGYRRVVATMWSINDVYATKLAKSFYQYLWDHPTEASRDGGFDGTLSAYALHHAVQELRRELGNDSERSLLTWVPFVHFGY